jgi:hypothetical protein
MDYEKYSELTKNVLYSKTQQLKIIFEPRKQNDPLLPFIPYIAVGGQILAPNSAIMPEKLAGLGIKLGIERFGSTPTNEYLFMLDVSEVGILLTPTDAFYTSERAQKERAMRGFFISSILVNFAKGDLWLGFTIFEFDEISRDIDTAIRRFVDLVPSFLKSLAVLFRH